MFNTIAFEKKGLKFWWQKLVLWANSWGFEEIGGGLFLLVATAVSMVLANSSIGERYVAFWATTATLGLGNAAITLSLQDWINEGFMTIFFFVIALEIKKEICFGALRSFRKAILPIVAALGGMIVPALLYFIVSRHYPMLSHGWGIPTATDIAFAVGILTIFRKRIPPVMIVFLLTLATADDMGAILLIACFYGKTLQLGYFFGALAVVAILFLMNQFKVYRGFLYFVVGVMLWFFLFKSGINPDIAGVITAFCIPVISRTEVRKYVENIEKLGKDFLKHDEQCVDKCLRNDEQQKILKEMTKEIKNVHSPMQRLTAYWQKYATFIVMPIFALANTAVVISFGDFRNLIHEVVSLGIILGLALGKPLGIVGFAYLAIKLKIAKIPDNLSWRYLLIAGIVGGIGFTMSLFIAELSFEGFEGTYLKMAKLGIIAASMISALVAAILILLVPKKKQAVN